MRLLMRLLLIALLAATAVVPVSAQEPEKAKDASAEGEKPKDAGEEAGDKNEPGDKTEKGEAKGEAKKPVKEPKEPPAWKIAERDRRKVEKHVVDYLVPGRTKRPDALAKLEKRAAKKFDGHDLLEDVGALVGIANRARTFSKKAGRKGRVVEVKVAPDVHGFPGGIGTVRYSMWLPKKYTERDRLWPLILALPNNKTWPDPAKYIKEAWTKDPAIADNYIIVVPSPQSKGDLWTRKQSYARAMIALRHVSGVFDQDKKTGGPATDMLRVYIDGGDAAAITAARFPELFAGVIIRHSDGRTPGGVNLRKAGGIPGVAACVIYSPKKRFEKQLANALRTEGGANTLVFEDEGNGLIDIGPIAKWLNKTSEQRQTQPREISYTVHEPSFQRCWWLTILDYDTALDPGAEISAVADRTHNTVRIEVSGVTRFELNLNDALVDLNRPLSITVIENDREYPFVEKTKLNRNLGLALSELVQSNHPWRVYPVRLTVDVVKLRTAFKVAEAKKKAEAEKEKAKKNTSVEVLSGEPAK